jgi:hypothetical protein
MFFIPLTPNIAFDTYSLVLASSRKHEQMSDHLIIVVHSIRLPKPRPLAGFDNIVGGLTSKRSNALLMPQVYPTRGSIFVFWYFLVDSKACMTVLCAPGGRQRDLQHYKSIQVGFTFLGQGRAQLVRSRAIISQVEVRRVSSLTGNLVGENAAENTKRKAVCAVN